MTITAPFATTDELIITESDPIIIADAPMLEVDGYSLLRDPIVPFLVIGLATFLAMIVAAYILSGPVI